MNRLHQPEDVAVAFDGVPLEYVDGWVVSQKEYAPALYKKVSRLFELALSRVGPDGMHTPQIEEWNYTRATSRVVPNGYGADSGRRALRLLLNTTVFEPNGVQLGVDLVLGVTGPMSGVLWVETSADGMKTSSVATLLSAQNYLDEALSW